MRTLVIAGLMAAMTAASAGAAPLGKPAPAAVSAECYGVKADYRGPELQVGYSWKARRAAACLATYPGLYNPRTDLVRVGPCVVRRCSL